MKYFTLYATLSALILFSLASNTIDCAAPGGAPAQQRKDWLSWIGVVRAPIPIPQTPSEQAAGGSAAPTAAGAAEIAEDFTVIPADEPSEAVVLSGTTADVEAREEFFESLADNSPYNPDKIRSGATAPKPSRSPAALVDFGGRIDAGRFLNKLTFLWTSLYGAMQEAIKLGIQSGESSVSPDNAPVFMRLYDNNLGAVGSLKTFIDTLHDYTERLYRQGYAHPVVYYLDLDSNNIELIEPRTFEKLTALRILKLNRNKLSTIIPGTFNGLSRLKKLELHNNQIALLPRGAFYGLNRLIELDLHFNPLDKIAPGAFAGLKHVKKLNLSHSKITELTEEMFTGLDSLEELNLSHIATIKSCDPAIFARMPKLRVVDLRGTHALAGTKSTYLREFYKSTIEIKCDE